MGHRQGGRRVIHRQVGGLTHAQMRNSFEGSNKPFLRIKIYSSDCEKKSLLSAFRDAPTCGLNRYEIARFGTTCAHAAPCRLETMGTSIDSPDARVTTSASHSMPVSLRRATMETEHVPFSPLSDSLPEMLPPAAAPLAFVA